MRWEALFLSEKNCAGTSSCFTLSLSPCSPPPPPSSLTCSLTPAMASRGFCVRRCDASWMDAATLEECGLSGAARVFVMVGMGMRLHVTGEMSADVDLAETVLYDSSNSSRQVRAARGRFRARAVVQPLPCIDRAMAPFFSCSRSPPCSSPAHVLVVWWQLNCQGVAYGLVALALCCTTGPPHV